MGEAHIRGRFITIEGVDGAGKSTQLALLREWLEGKRIPCLFTEEPGGTPIGEKIKDILLDTANSELCPETELFLFEAQRAQHTAQVIRPALEKGMLVISSRFADATTVYQGYVRGLDMEAVQKANMTATGGLEPQLTIVLDVDENTGMSRVVASGKPDRMEAQGCAFLKKVREGYKELAKRHPERIVVVNASRDIGAVHHDIIKLVEPVIRGLKA